MCSVCFVGTVKLTSTCFEPWGENSLSTCGGKFPASTAACAHEGSGLDAVATLTPGRERERQLSPSLKMRDAAAPRAPAGRTAPSSDPEQSKQRERERERARETTCCVARGHLDIGSKSGT